MKGLSRHCATAAAVLALHAAAVWALNAGLRMRVAEMVVPVQMLATLVDAPTPPKVNPPAPPEPRPVSPPVKQARPTPTKATPKPDAIPSPKPVPERVAMPSTVATPLPLAVDPIPSPMAPTVTQVANAKPAEAHAATPSVVASPAMPAPVASAVAIAAPAPAPPVAPAVEPPSTDAQYLLNPKPRYPPISHRLGEQGTVLVQVLVSEKGLAKDAQIKTSSGFYRLDNAALTTVLTWRFVPGKRAGVPTAMWFTVPITFGIQ